MNTEDAEDVEDVVAVVGEREGVHDSVEVHGCSADDHPEREDPDAGEEVLLAGLMEGGKWSGDHCRREDGENGGEDGGGEYREGKESDIGPDIEHLRGVEGGNVVGFVTYEG